MILITNLSRSSFKFNVNIAKYLFLHKTWQTKYTNIIHYFIKEILCLYVNSDKYGTEFITLKYYCYSWESACKIVTSVLYLLVFTSLCSPLSSVLICVTNSTWQEGQYVTTRFPYKRLHTACILDLLCYSLSFSLSWITRSERSQLL